MLVPLLRLPENATRLILQTMEVKDSLALSILSNRVKGLVRDTICRLDPLIFVNVGSIITIEVSSWFSLKFYTVNKNRQCKMSTPRTVLVVNGNGTRGGQKWKNPKMKIKDWLDHLLNVFEKNKTDLISFSPGFERFDIEALQRNIQSVRVLKISEDLTHEESKMIFKKFFNNFDVPFLENNVFETREELRKFLLSNFKYLYFGHSARVTDFRLSDLLMVNIPNIFLRGDSLTEKELNRFLKLWMTGMSPNLCMLDLEYPLNRVINKEEVLKGINYQEFEDDRVLTITNYPGKTNVKGGIEIHGKNGNKAVIQFKNSYNIVIHVCN